MKKVIFILITLTIPVTVGFSLSDSDRTESWGYILHSSNLSRSYLEKTIPRYKVISITGYKLSKSGKLKYKSNNLIKSAVSIARENNVVIYPLVSFRSASIGHRILNSGRLRNISILSIREMVTKGSFSGIHLDFEYLPPRDSVKLKEFLIEIRRVLYNKKISMAIFPQVDFPDKWSRFHDLKIIAPLLDEIVIMCYDYHRPGTKPGAVTDIKWAEKNIIKAMRYMKGADIWLGMPAYGYRWSVNGKATPISARYGVRLAKKFGFKRHKSGNLYFSYKKSGRRYSVYISDKQTRICLKQLAHRYKLAGTAIWRLGFED